MNDLGFGIVDKRSVLIVLFTLGLSKLMFGYDIPIDTSNFVTAFLGLLVLTGFIYATRSIVRLALAACSLVIRIPYDLVANFKNRNIKMRGLRGGILIFILSLSESFVFGFVYPSFLNREWKFGGYYYEPVRLMNFELGVLGALDRLFLIGIAFSTTVPSLAIELRMFGFWGILVMLLIYVLTGTFSFILDDSILRAELQHKELVSAASHPNINFPSTITTVPKTPDYGD
jgi:hypothetical protein